MKFLSIAAVALGLASKVLAAPATVPAADVSVLSRDVSAYLEILEGRLAGAQSETSLISERNSSPATIITSAVLTLKSSVSVELTNINTCGKYKFDEEIAIKIQKSLVIIASSLNQTIHAIGPCIEGSVELLVDAEVKLLIKALTDLKIILADIDATLKFLAKIAITEAKFLLVAELAVVKGLILALVTPITGFAFLVGGGLKAALKAELQIAASGCIVIAGKAVTSLGLIH